MSGGVDKGYCEGAVEGGGNKVVYVVQEKLAVAWKMRPQRMGLLDYQRRGSRRGKEPEKQPHAGIND